MFARVTTAQFEANRIEDAMTLAREQLVPQLRREAGFKGYWALADRASGKVLTLSLWESEEALRESEAASQRVSAQGHRTVGGSSTKAHYEILIQE